MKEVRVLQVFGSLDMGGAESRMMDIYRTIDKRQCQFDFITMQAEKQYYENEIKSMGGRVIRLDSPRKKGIIHHFKQLRNCMRRGHYDAVHSHTSYHSGIVMLAAWLEHIPVRISHARTTNSKHSGIPAKVVMLFGKGLINTFATRKLAISKEAGQFVFGGVGSFQVVPNAIDVKKYLTISSEKLQDLKNQLGIERTDLVIGQIGRFETVKNHEFTIEWFEQFAKKNPNTKLVLVGDGSTFSHICEIVHNKELQDRVIFTGIRSDIYQLIHVFDVLFFPSLYEGLGSVALEAQAAGIPVVMSTGIPQEADMGLGLVWKCSLNGSFLLWNDAVCAAKAKERCSSESIREAFADKGYDLDTIAKQYLLWYGNN